MKDQNLDGLTDEQLMLSYRDGQAAAFDVLYARHKGGLYRYVLRQLGQNNEQANEVFQDVWMNVIKASKRYSASAKFATYLYRIAHNRIVDHWRSNRMEMSDCDPDTLRDDSGSPDRKAQLSQQHHRLRQEIRALPEEQRNAFLLKEEAALSLEQIAEVTGVNRETVKSRLRYAIKRLRQSLVFSP